MSWLEFYYVLHLQVQWRDLRANKSVFWFEKCKLCTLLFFPLFLLSISATFFCLSILTSHHHCWLCCSGCQGKEGTNWEKSKLILWRLVGFHHFWNAVENDRNTQTGIVTLVVPCLDNLCISDFGNVMTRVWVVEGKRGKGDMKSRKKG